MYFTTVITPVCDGSAAWTTGASEPSAASAKAPATNDVRRRPVALDKTGGVVIEFLPARPRTGATTGRLWLCDHWPNCDSWWAFVSIRLRWAVAESDVHAFGAA